MSTTEGPGTALGGGVTTPAVAARQNLIFGNFLALSAGAVGEHAVNLFSSIYVRRVLGVAAIGQVSWTTSVISYFGLLVSPGFQLIAKREVARNPEVGGRYVMLLTLLQTLLAALGFGLAVAFSFIVPREAEVRLLLVLQALGLFVMALDPSWLLQARERMGPLSVASLASNLLQAFSLVLLVHEPADVMRYVLLAYPFRLGLYGFILHYGLRHGLLTGRSLRPTLQGGWGLLWSALPIGLSQFAILSYSNSDTVFLGFTHGDQVVGLYSTAYSLMLVPVVLARAMLNAYFPALSRVAGSAEDSRRVSGELLKALVWLGFPIAVLGWAVGRHVVLLLYGQDFAPSGLLFEWLSLNIALFFFNMGLVEPLIAWNAQKLAFKCTLAGAVTNVGANLILIPRYGPWGAVVTTILAELIVMLFAMSVRRGLRPTGWQRSLLGGVATCVPAAILARWADTQVGWYLGLLAGLAVVGAGALLFERRGLLQIYRGFFSSARLSRRME